MNSQSYIILEIKTPNAKNDRISACLATDPRGAVLLRTFVDPRTKFEPIDVAISGVRPQDVLGAPTFETVWNESLRELLESRVVIGHNVRFDLDVLARAASDAGLDPPVARYIDLQKTARKLFEKEYCSLEDVAEELGLELRRDRLGDETQVVRELAKLAFQELEKEDLTPKFYFYSPAPKKKIRW